MGFLIAGVQKGGTTTLYAALRRHPHIAQAKPKELHYFDDDTRDWQRPDYSVYERRFGSGFRARIAGEATPSYLFWPRAMERIRVYNPQMRFIFSFRDPIERAFSQWCMNRDGHAADTPPFSVAIREFAPSTMPASPAEAGGRRQSYVARGYYGAQIRGVLDEFGRDQLLLLDFHRTFGAWQETVDAMTDFLGIDRFPEAHAPKHRRAQATQLTGEPPTGDDIAFLADRFANDLADFAATTGLDISSWPTTAVAGGLLDPSALAERLATRAGLAAPARG